MDLEYMIWRMRKDLLGIAQYAFNAEPDQAPSIVSCQTLVWWAYMQIGICIPWLISDQVFCGRLVGFIEEWRIGDLILRVGTRRNWNGVGHVGVLTKEGTVIHASWQARGVVEESVQEFLLGRQDVFRGVRRIT